MPEPLLAHARQGMFGDPSYGGNVDRAGWALLGYSGPRPVWTAADQGEASPRTELMGDAAKRLGWHPFPAPAAIDPARCTYCGFCTCNGCHVTAKGSTDATVIPRAEATGRLHVRTGARVVRIDPGPGARPRRDLRARRGRERFQPADVVLLAGFVYENVRLLLLLGLGRRAGRRRLMADRQPALQDQICFPISKSMASEEST